MAGPETGAPPDAGVGAVEDDDLATQLGAMLRAFWATPQRNRLIALAVALVTVIGATAWAQIRLNAWNQPFYNALTARNLPAFVTQLGVFAMLAGVLLVLNVAQTWLNQMTRLVLRQGLVGDLFGEWLAPLRAFRLANAGPIGTNPDQRLAADAQHLTDLTTDLGIGLLQSTLLLASFIGVLWELSDGMGATIFGVVVNPPGYMVWCALVYAGTASLLSYLVGRPLIRLDAEHYAREADLRFELVRVSEGVEAIAMYGGEAAERGRLDATFGTVLAISRRIVSAVTRLTWVTAGYGWFTIVAPILVAMPSYFAGKMSFGELMMVVGAFNQVQQSLRWYVDNFSAIADWRATLLRVAAFRKAVIAMDRLGQSTGRFTLTEGAGTGIRIADLCIAGPVGTVRLDPATLDLKPGDRVLIGGGHGEGKTLFFRALIGLWPWGSGTIERPRRERIMFLPARAYLPTGTLRACLTYPQSETAFDDAAIAAALTDVGLQRLVPQLGKFHRWERHLSENEKHCLAFARAILQRPDWVVIDDALNFIERGARQRIESIFMTRLTDMGVINIGHDGGRPGFYTRQVTLTVDAAGPKFTPASGAS
ncbi:MAG: ATP-binding cassette domain-containing protein [Rhodobacteraceae bacterium]|nr:ATP-binding cassette domain-containing protein [Paracoccaceae bacterium]